MQIMQNPSESSVLSCSIHISSVTTHVLKPYAEENAEDLEFELLAVIVDPD